MEFLEAYESGGVVAVAVLVIAQIIMAELRHRKREEECATRQDLEKHKADTERKLKEMERSREREFNAMWTEIKSVGATVTQVAIDTAFLRGQFGGGNSGNNSNKGT